MPRLSHDLPWLNTRGNRIRIASLDQPVLLRGVNRSGLEYSEPVEDGFCAAAGITSEEIAYLVEDWNCDILRIPFNQDWALRGRRGHSAEAYLQDLDRVIAWAASQGAYTLLDLQWLQADEPYGGNRNYVAPLPDLLSIGLWEMLGERYREEPAVLFDLFNEPHDPLPDDLHPLIRPDGVLYPPGHRTVTMADWQPWAERLIAAIRGRGARNLIFVSGVNWGYDLRGLTLDRYNVVYSTHIYRNKGWDWDEAFGHLTQDVPVFAAEWGGTRYDLAWGRSLASYLDRLSLGWTAWSWSDFPHLQEAALGPTAFGSLVREQLLGLSSGAPGPGIA